MRRAFPSRTLPFCQTVVVMPPPFPVLRPSGDLTAATQDAFDASCAPYLQGAAGLVVDLEAVTLLTSAGLGRLVWVGRTFGERGASVALAGGRRTIVKLIRTVGLDQVMPHFDSVREATRWLESRGPARETAAD